ncbi:brain and acute leukemia cytoplasmic protein [Coturnix japonica]|uniref:brain and acute leukemia cytoplasmic protein n=1 Tax=Coturnix japonica TaxID=93934 RepID=UPI000776D928|nr:brain and acute leukemia cytoplasmic protein [Coturnix japonica]
MGCGGSRADAIEPRYYESWTRETESTWLTNTDSESPQEPGGAEPGSRELGAGRAGILEDGKSTQTGGTTTPATTGILSTEKRTISGAQCVNAAGAGPPRQSSFRAAESKRDSQKMSTKEVTISVSKAIRPGDRRTTKNCVK